MLLYVVAAELSDGSVEVGKGVGRDLNISSYADKGHLAGSGMMDGLTVECGTNPGTKVTHPFRQGLGYGGFNFVGFIRCMCGLNIGHGKVVFG